MQYLQSWVRQLRWQRLQPPEARADTLIDHLDGILNHCRVKVRFGVGEAINGISRYYCAGYEDIRPCAACPES